jgi:hypothetical protein
LRSWGLFVRSLRTGFPACLSSLSFQLVGQVDGLERPYYMKSSILSDEFLLNNEIINWWYKDFINQAIGT